MSPLPSQSISFICVARQLLLNRGRALHTSWRSSRLAPYILGFSGAGREQQELLTRLQCGTLVNSCRSGRYLKQSSKEYFNYSYQMLEDSKRTMDHTQKNCTVASLCFEGFLE